MRISLSMLGTWGEAWLFDPYVSFMQDKLQVPHIEFMFTEIV